MIKKKWFKDCFYKMNLYLGNLKYKFMLYIFNMYFQVSVKVKYVICFIRKVKM